MNLTEKNRKKEIGRKLIRKMNAIALFSALAAILACTAGCTEPEPVPSEPESESVRLVVWDTPAPSEEIVSEPEPEPEPVPVKLTDELEFMSDTEEIDISGTDVTELDMDAFLDSMTGLKKITMKDCGLDNDGYAALQDAHPDVRIIWDIKVKTYTIPTDSVGFSTLLANEYQPRVDDEDCKYLKYCTDMVALDLGHNYITNLDFLEYMPNLRVLILVDNFDSPSKRVRLSDISALKYTPHLRYLELFANNVTDMSVIADLKELEDLNVCYNPVNTAEPFKDLPNLQKLWIYNTSIPWQEINELKELYPDTKIVTSGTGSVDQGWREGPHYNAMRNMVSHNVMDEVYAFEGGPEVPKEDEENN